ncbi:MAG TPA: RHS repeat-associated core domain-containing protein, partial [Pseudomonas sp.]|nr:RHS repeat-associated core domain-containing protein [Pseudomonas sp.]
SQRSTSYAVEVDVAGNYTRYSQNRRYSYDEQGRLSTTSDANGVLLASYRYNALGQRVFKTLANGASWTYLYGPDGQLLGQEQYSASTGKKLKGQYWVWLDAMPLAGIELSFNSSGAVSSSNVYYLHADHLNSPRLASNQNQALIWSWNSDAFGVGMANQDVDGNGITTDIPLRFPGQQYDAHSALHYNYFRDYDPETGRYVESDPIGLAGGLNTYGYVLGNPLKYIDPRGQSILVAPGAEAGAAVGTFVCPGVGTVVGGVIGAGLGAGLSWYLGDKLFNESAGADPDPSSGNDPDRGDLTKAGRAGQKHGDRAGSAFPPATGSAADKNRQGQDILDGIVNSPDRTDRPNRHGGTDVHESPDGRGARFDQNGKFTGFLEPR